MLMLAILLALLLPIDTALAIECRAAPVKDNSYWQWRQIDGRRCWVSGRRRPQKAELHWTATNYHRPGVVSAAGGGDVRRTTSPPVAVPFKEDALTFDARWNALWQTRR